MICCIHVIAAEKKNVHFDDEYTHDVCQYVDGCWGLILYKGIKDHVRNLDQRGLVRAMRLGEHPRQHYQCEVRRPRSTLHSSHALKCSLSSSCPAAANFCKVACSSILQRCRTESNKCTVMCSSFERAYHSTWRLLTFSIYFFSTSYCWYLIKVRLGFFDNYQNLGKTP